MPLLADFLAAQAKYAGGHCPPCKGYFPDIRGMAVGALNAELVASVAAFRKGLDTFHVGIYLSPSCSQIRIPVVKEVFVKFRGRLDKFLSEKLLLLIGNYKLISLMPVLFRN